MSNICLALSTSKAMGGGFARVYKNAYQHHLFYAMAVVAKAISSIFIEEEKKERNRNERVAECARLNSEALPTAAAFPVSAKITIAKRGCAHIIMCLHKRARSVICRNVGSSNIKASVFTGETVHMPRPEMKLSKKRANVQRQLVLITPH